MTKRSSIGVVLVLAACAGEGSSPVEWRSRGVPDEELEIIEELGLDEEQMAEVDDAMAQEPSAPPRLRASHIDDVAALLDEAATLSPDDEGDVGRLREITEALYDLAAEVQPQFQEGPPIPYGITGNPACEIVVGLAPIVSSYAETAETFAHNSWSNHNGPHSFIATLMAIVARMHSHYAENRLVNGSGVVDLFDGMAWLEIVVAESADAETYGYMSHAALPNSAALYGAELSGVTKKYASVTLDMAHQCVPFI
jgi:hypothetical protein